MRNLRNIIASFGPKHLLALLIVGASFGMVQEAHATHAMGADIEYECTSSPNTYRIRVSFYRDCLGSPAPSSVSVSGFSTSCGLNTSNFTLTQLPCPPNPPGSLLTPCEVSPLCPAFECASCCSGNPPSCPPPVGSGVACLPGVQQYVYEGTIVLPAQCPDWIIEWSLCCRNNAITNLNNPGAQDMYVHCLINNTNDPNTNQAYCSDGPSFSTLPVPYVCDLVPFNYNHGAVDADGDSLYYTSINPLDDYNVNIAYSNAAFNPNNPFWTLGNNFNLDPFSGQMTFTPNGMNQQAVVTLRVEEYRDGVLIGYTMRDIQIVVLAQTLCNNSIPDVTQITNVFNGLALDSNTVQVCPGSNLIFEVPVYDAPGRNLTVTSNLQLNPGSPIPGANFSVTGSGDTVSAVISWTPTATDTGCHQFVISAENDACPFTGSESQFFEICVFTEVRVNPDSAVYCGTPVPLSANGGTVFTWSPTAGLSDPTSFTPTAAPAVPTTYVFTSDCGADSVFVDVNPPFAIEATADDSIICRNGLTQLHLTVDSTYAPYTFQWTPNHELYDLGNNPNDTIQDPFASPLFTTTYYGYATGNNGCVRFDTATVFVLGVAPAVRAEVDDDTICPGNTVQLEIFSEPESCGLSIDPCNGSSVSGVVGNGTGTQSGSVTTYPSLYGNWNNAARHQMLYTAAELQGVSTIGGKIEEIAFDIASLVSSATLKNFEIKMGCTSANQLSAWETNLVTVFTPKDVIPTAGWNTHVFDNTFDWDGTSNIVVEVCWYNQNSFQNFNNKCRVTNTGVNTLIYANGGTNICGFNTGSVSASNSRPNADFTICQNTFVGLNIDWSPGAGPNGVSDSTITNPTANPISTTTYIVDVDDGFCTGTDFVTVFTTPGQMISSYPDTFICQAFPIQLNAGVIGNTAGLTYNWTSSPNDPTLTSPNSPTPTVSPTQPTWYYITVNGGVCPLVDSVLVDVGSELPVSSNISGISCFGLNDGSVTVVPGGGVGPYTFQWSDSFGNTPTRNNLGQQTLYVTVTDNALCVGYDTIVINEPTQLTVNMTGSHIPCAGDGNGTVTANANGGTPGYDYQWTPSSPNAPTITGLNGGMYTVSVTDDSGCVQVDTFVVNEPTALTVIMGGTNVSMNGGTDGTASATPSGGTGSYTYAWSPGPLPTTGTISNLPVGTYTVTVTDSNGCTVVDSFTVNEPPPLVVLVEKRDNPCFGDSLGWISVSASGGIEPYTYTWSTSQTDTFINGLAAGIYTLSVQDSTQSFTVTVPVTIIEPPLLTVNIQTIDVSCNGAGDGGVIATPSGGSPNYNYNWSPSGPNNSVNGNLGGGWYSVTVTDDSGCVVTDSGFVFEAPALSFNYTTTPVSSFGGNDGGINVSPIGGISPYSFNWSPALPNDSVQTNLTTGWYTLTITDSSGCTFVDSIFVSEPPPIVLVVNKTNNPCNGDSLGSITVTASGGIAPYHFQWNTGNPADTFPSLSGLIAGTYILSVQDSTQSFTVDTAIVITEPAPIVINFDTTNVSCFGLNDGSLTANPSGGTSPFFYDWTPGGATTPTINNLVAGTYCVEVMDNNNCVDTACVTITQPDTLTAGITVDGNVSCNGGNDGAATVISLGGVQSHSYNWTVLGSAGSSVTTLPAGNHTVTVTDANMCTVTANFVITEPTALTLNLPVQDASCPQSTDGWVYADVNGGAGDYTYQWDAGTGNQTTDTAFALMTGNYSVTVTDSNGCTITDNVAVGFIYVLTFNGGTDSASCFAGNDGRAWVTTVNGTSPYTYQWSVPGSPNNDTIFNLQSGSVSITMTDNLGCTASNTYTVDEPAQITSQTFGRQPSCTGLSDGIAWIEILSGGSSPFTYDWSNTVNPNDGDTTFNLSSGSYTVTITDNKGCQSINGVSITDPAPIVLTSANITPITCFGANDGIIQVQGNGGTGGLDYNWSGPSPTVAGIMIDDLAPGAYGLTITDLNGCTYDTTFTMANPPELRFLFATVDSASCPGYADGVITVIATGGTGEIQYSVDGLNFQANPVLGGLESGVYTAVAQDANSCSIDTTFGLFEPVPMQITLAVVDSIIELGDVTQLQASFYPYGPEDINTYDWSPLDGLSCGDCQNPVAGPYNDVSYTMSVDYLNNCHAEASIDLYVKNGPDFYVPNAFTPNGDDVNDFFMVYGSALKRVSMTVYDRWGEKMYASDSQYKGWDGRYKGELMRPGVYIYLVEVEYLNGKEATRRGSVTLLR